MTNVMKYKYYYKATLSEEEGFICHGEEDLIQSLTDNITNPDSRKSQGFFMSKN